MARLSALAAVAALLLAAVLLSPSAISPARANPIVIQITRYLYPEETLDSAIAKLAVAAAGDDRVYAELRVLAVRGNDQIEAETAEAVRVAKEGERLTVDGLEHGNVAKAFVALLGQEADEKPLPAAVARVVFLLAIKAQHIRAAKAILKDAAKFQAETAFHSSREEKAAVDAWAARMARIGGKPWTDEFGRVMSVKRATAANRWIAALEKGTKLRGRDLREAVALMKTDTPVGRALRAAKDGKKFADLPPPIDSLSPAEAAPVPKVDVIKAAEAAPVPKAAIEAAETAIGSTTTTTTTHSTDGADKAAHAHAATA